MTGLPDARVLAQTSWESLPGPLHDVTVGYVNGFETSGAGTWDIATSNGIYVSTDKGLNWMVYSSFPYPQTPVMGTVRLDENTMLIIGGYYDLYRTSDKGLTWTRLPYLFPDRPIGVCRIAALGSDLFAHTQYSLYRSTDHGSTWANITPGFHIMPQSPSLVVKPDRGELYLVSSDNGINVSSNQGETWLPLGFPSIPTELVSAAFVTALGVYPDGTIIASSSPDGLVPGGIYGTSDRGTQWNKFSEMHADDIWISNTGAAFATAGMGHSRQKNDLYVSMDRGKNWTRTSIVDLHRLAGLMKFDGSTAYFLNGDVLSTTIDNGATWTSKTIRGEARSGIQLLEGTASGILMAAGQDLTMSTDHGGHWTSISAGLPSTNVSSIHLSAADQIILTLSSGETLLSDDLGYTWQPALLPQTVTTINTPSAGDGGSLFAVALVRSASGQPLRYRIVQSTDTGNSWSFASDTSDAGTDMRILAGNGTGTLLAHGSDGLFRSTDNARTWIRIPDHAPGSSIAVIHAEDSENTWLIGANTGLYRSRDNGDTWMRIAEHSGPVFRWSIASSCQHICYSALGSVDGIRYVRFSADGGDTWKDFSQGLGDFPLNDLCIAGKVLFAASNLGIFRHGGARMDALLQPMPLSPAAGSVLPPDSVLLTWSNVCGAEGYDLQVSSDTAFAVLFASHENVSLASRMLRHLENNTTYHWRLRARNDDTVSTWSTPPSFFTILEPVPEAPLLLSPLDKTRNIPRRILLEWSPTQYSSQYTLQYSTSSDFRYDVTEIDSVSGTNILIGELRSNQEYFWRVAAGNARGKSDWSAVWSFQTIMDIPDAPLLTSPPSLSSVPERNIALRWESMKDVTHFTVQVDEDSTFDTPVIEQRTVYSAHTVPHLAHGRNFFWRVCATNPVGTSPWSDTWSFLTEQEMLSAPGLISPENDARDLPDTILLRWSKVADAGAYRIQLASDPEFGLNTIDTTAGTTEHVVTGLMRNSRYFWRVRATAGDAEGPWSVTWNFETLAQVPAVPLLESPGNSAREQDLELVLSWFHADGAVSYDVQVASDPSFVPALIDWHDVHDTTAFISGLDEQAAYHWRVRAVNAGGASSWSETRSFTTRRISTSTEESRSLEDFRILPCYPNPVHTHATFTVYSDRRERISLRIYDCLGKLRYSTMHIPHAGWTSITFDATALSAGLYHYELRCKDAYGRGIMMVLK
ncbi:MAG: hypothetical protein JXA28_06685 [Bacteroidetes bacterium]|nr:hypothetical protein [Bacteroidota bacterium]